MRGFIFLNLFLFAFAQEQDLTPTLAKNEANLQSEYSASAACVQDIKNLIPEI